MGVGEWSATLGVAGGWVTALLLGLAILAAVGLGVREQRRAPASERARLLLGLRVATALAGFLVAVQPAWVGARFLETQGRLALLVDASRSMAVADDGDSRAERARRLLADWGDSAGAEDAEVALFGDGVRATSFGAIREGVPATDDRTRIVSSIEALLERDARGDIGAVVVVSDGAELAGDPDLERLAALGVRVHAVAAAPGTAFRDDAVAALQADSVAFLRQDARVRVVVRSVGGSGAPIPVTLRRGDEVVREVLAVPDAAGEAAVELPFAGDRLGRTVYRVSIPVEPGDVVPENNERAFLVRVARDRLRVLLVAGRPSWDERFLRAFLERDPAIDLISFFILRTAADLTMASPDELALIPFPTDELFSEHLGSFDLVVFQGFEHGPYQMAGYLPRIRDYVRRGGGFAMIGGDLSFASGGYAESPIAEILPVTMPPSGTPASRVVAPGRFRPARVEAMARHPLLELHPDPLTSAEVWSALAPLEGANVLTGVKDGAVALLSHPERRTPAGEPMPILAVTSAGRGRSLALAVDTSHRWGMGTAGLSGDASAYERFWERALRWLTQDPSLEPSQLTTDRERYGPGARVTVEGLLRDERYVPHAGREVQLRVVDGSGAEVSARVVSPDAAGRVSAELEAPARPSGYRVVARLVGSAGELADEGFLVELGGDELADPRPRPALLRAVAEATGGTFHAIEDAPALSAFDATRRRALGPTREAPFASGWALAVVAALFGAEWLLRRRWSRS